MPAPAKWKIEKLDRLESVGVQELAARLKAARQRVAIIVHSAARDRKLVVSGRNRERLYNQIGGVYLQLDNGLKDWGKDLVTKGAIDWHDAAIRDITGQTGTDPSNDVTKFSREYAEDIFKRVHPENGRSLAAVLTDRMSQSDIKALRQATVDVYRDASLSGMTLQQISGEIRTRWDEIAGNLISRDFVDAAGRTWDDGRYMQMLVRTTMARVARDSYFETLTKNGDDLAIIQNVDGEACDICQAWDGVIISITGTDDRYPSYNQALNAGWGHPNCRCLAERVDETIDKDAIKQQAETPTPDLARQDGETDAAYRSRVTEGMADYSQKFWPVGEDTAGAAASRAAAERAAAAKAALDAARKAAEAAAAKEAARIAAEKAAAAAKVEAERLAAEKAAAATAKTAKSTGPALMTPAEVADFKTAVRVTMADAKISPKVQQALDDIPDPAWARIRGSKPLKIGTKNIGGVRKSGAYYASWQRYVRLNKDPRHWSGSPSTLKHELGHDVHYVTKAISDHHINPDLDLAMKTDLAAWEAAGEKRLGKQAFLKKYAPTGRRADMLDDVLKEHGIHTAQAVADDHRVSSMSDTIGGLSRGRLGSGHEVKYYRQDNNGAMEAYANIFRGITSGWAEYAKAFPLTTSWIRISLGL